RALRRHEWDAVVLQNQSTRPAMNASAFQADVRALAERIRGRNARPILFGTWARASWNGLYERSGFPSSPGRLRRALRSAFERAEQVEGVEVAPVTEAFFRFRRQHPTPPLHGRDGNHATPAGAYLAACVIYGTLTGREVASADVSVHGLAPAVARRLRRTADRSLEARSHGAGEETEMGPTHPSDN
ncbi:MAG: DUF4886 domain-containing protein, partial [Bradymonadaceae bacterium]